jgi:hypothetical protein
VERHLNPDPQHFFCYEKDMMIDLIEKAFLPSCEKNLKLIINIPTVGN